MQVFAHLSVEPQYTTLSWHFKARETNISEMYFRVSTQEKHIINLNNKSDIINDIRPYPLC